MRNTELLNELVQKQLDIVDRGKKMNYNELKRFSKYINSTIFDESKCCLWNGYITNLNNPGKGIYINFYFRGKKPVLHRLLYSNFVGHLAEDEYLKFVCDNKGRCCNVKHLQKFHYTKQCSDKKQIDTKENLSETKIKNDLVPEQKTISFVVCFD